MWRQYIQMEDKQLMFDKFIQNNNVKFCFFVFVELMSFFLSVNVVDKLTIHVHSSKHTTN